VLFPGLSRLGMFAPRVLLWEAFVSLALLGYGFAALRVLRLQRQPLAVSACTGVAVWLLLGGWLNLANLASRRVLLAALGLGFLCCLWELARPEVRDGIAARLRHFSEDKLARNLAIPILAYFLLLFAVNLRPIAWNAFDDPQAYMAYADKAAAFGSLQSDPFSERRVNTGMGGGIFLNVTMLAAGDDSTMGYIDAGFGYLVFILCIWSLAKALGLTGWRAVALLYLVPIFTLARINLTIAYLSTALALAMLLLLMRVDWEAGLPPRMALLLGVLLGADCSIKSSNIPLCGMLLVFCGIAFARHARDWRRLLPFCLTGIPLAAVVLPWMLHLHHDEGTYLFPNLGRGDHISAFGLLPLPAHTAPALQSLLIAAPDIVIILLAGLLLYLLVRGLPLALRIPTLSFACAALVSVPLIAASVAGESIDRYTLPFTTPCLFLLAALTLLARRSGKQALSSSLAVVSLLACGVFCYKALSKREYLYPDFTQLRSLLNVRHRRSQPYTVYLDASTMQRNAEIVRRAQDAVPPGQTVLESTETAYGYDWRRNPIYIADYPGMAGLPPGPPLFSDAEAMRAYLLDCGIHYVIYDRSLYTPLDFAVFRAQPHWILTRAEKISALKRIISPTPWGRMEYYVENHTRLQFQQLAEHHPVIYDDGRIEVIRLDE